MSRVADFYRSAIGKKAVMAVTGVILLGFVLLHMIGNLKIYFPGTTPGEHLNEYAKALRTLGAPILMNSQALWIMRLILIASVVLHITAATQLTIQSWAARPVKYKRRDYIETTYAARTMRWGGVIIFLFVIWHLLDFTFGTVNPHYNPENVYGNVVASFSVWWIAAFYILANLLLGLHIYHGIWSGIRTLGWQQPLMDPLTRGLAAVFAVVIAVGNISIPVSVLAGWVR